MLGPGEWTHDDESGKSTCTKLCPVNQEIYSVTVDTDQYIQWKHGGKFIQDVMPELNADDREFLISGTTPAMWEDMFKGMEE